MKPVNCTHSYSIAGLVASSGAAVFTVLAVLMAALTGCGGNSNSNSSANTPVSYSAVSGVAQKGPLLQGSVVIAQELDASLQAVGSSYAYRVNSDLGTFSPSSAFASPYIEITATGYYVDEVSNGISAGKISLKGITDLSATNVLNVNLLTTLAYRRVKTLVAGSHMSLAAAQQQAKSEVLAALNIPDSGNYGSFESLDLSHTGEGDKLLVAVSGLFVNGGSSDQVESLIESFQNDIADNGVIDAVTTKAALAASARTLDPAQVALNINAEYSAVGLNDSAADIRNWISPAPYGAMVKTTYAARQPQALQLLAGSLGGPGGMDGAGLSAQFNAPGDIAVDGSGNIFVADSRNDTIRKISPNGNVTTLAGVAGYYGSADGMGPAARFYNPTGVAVDANGTVYVADSGNNTIRRISPAGNVTTLAGLASNGGSADGAGSAARFSHPGGIALDAGGNLYVADTGNNTIRKVAADGLVTTLAGTAQVWGSADGSGAAASFSSPSAVGVGSDGTVYVADSGNNSIRKISAAGVVTSFAGASRFAGNADGAGASARFYYPSSITVDAGGNIYVADSANGVLRRITPAGVVTTLAAPVTGGSDRPVFRFNDPDGVAVDTAGNVYVAEAGDNTIYRISPANVETDLAGTRTIGDVDGQGYMARFHCPHGLAADGSGNVYVADSENNAVRKIDASGAASTLAGGAGGQSPLNFPSGVAVDGSGNVYVADSGNNAIRKISPSGVLSTLAGNLQYGGHADGKGSGAQFFFPKGIAVDASGNVFVADTYNNTIRKISADGLVSTLAGSAGVAGHADGKGADARFSDPNGIAVDSNGIVYVSDSDNATIRRISPDGLVTTLAGTAGIRGAVDAEGAGAQFYYPVGLAVSSSGSLYVADAYNDTIREITASGMVSTVVGQAGTPGYSTGALPGLIFDPLGLAVLPGGGLVFNSNNAILTVSGL